TFFELGGHSLLAIRLIKRIQEQFGQELPISAVFEAATIEQMSNLLRGDYRPKDRSNLVPLHPHGSRRPLFFVHPGGGGVGNYRDLAKLLGEEQPFYGIQALDEEEIRLGTILSVEDRAAQYLKAIREAQPHGPYLLGGWSFGGFVAYEMAQQIHRHGEEVAGLILLDIIGETPRSLPSDGDDADQLLQVIGEATDVQYSLDAVLHSSPGERLQYLIDELIKAKALTSDVTAAQVQVFLKGLTRRNQSLIDYDLQPYSGPISLIRAEKGKSVEGTGISSEDRTRGFSRLAPAGVQVYFTPGSHDDLVLPPYVEKLAEVMKQCLSDIETQQCQWAVRTTHVGA
ncbi:MAG: thioesterase domain-containing protein, partial [Candidatus Angelobacter sp.]